MRYGFYLPTRGPLATRDGVLSLAREGERLGLHSAMIADHIVFRVVVRVGAPTLDEFCLTRYIRYLLHFGRREIVFNLKEHRSSCRSFKTLSINAGSRKERASAKLPCDG